MYQLAKKGFLIVGLLVLAYILGPIMREYMHNHSYYLQFLGGDGKWQHLTILLLGLVCALIPGLYLAQTKKVRFWPLMILIWIGLWIFSTAYVGIKADLLGSAWMKMLINTGFLFGLGVLFSTQLTALGTWINARFLHLDQLSARIRFLFSFGLGLIAFLFLEYVLLLLNIAFPIVNRLLWLAGIYLIWFSRSSLRELRKELMDEVFPHHNNQDNTSLRGSSLIYLLTGLILAGFAWVLFAGDQITRAWLMSIGAVGSVVGWVYQSKSFTRDGGGLSKIFTLRGFADIALFILLLLFIRYFYNGFVLAYIPYPTAWDANHAYMFTPKMFALHNGYYWTAEAMRGFGGIWLSYITYWFSLFTPTRGFLGISPDTVAIEMNFLSGLFVAIFGTGLVRAVISVVRRLYKDSAENTTTERLLTILGSFLIWQWMSSGMGAFLVFIDNKTDMGVLTLVIVALLSGFLFLRSYLSAEAQDNTFSSSTKKWLILSGVFFAFAALAKPTALFDVVNFFMLLWGSWFGLLGVFLLPLLILGVLALIKNRGVTDYFSSTVGAWMAILGAGGVAGDLLLQGYKKVITYGKYLLLWIVSFLVVAVGVKMLYYIPDVIFYGNNDRGVKEWVQTILLAQENPVLPVPATCSLQSEGLSQVDQLYADLKPIVGSAYAEDIGRYVGYGWKGNPGDQQRGVLPFINPRWAQHKAEGCYSFSPFFLNSRDAVALCKTQSDRESFDATRLSAVQGQLRPSGEAYKLIEMMKAGIGTASVSELTTTYREQLLALDSIMQGESMQVKNNTATDSSGTPLSYKEVYLPYKYLNFLNITFNRSLQNLSSYYTDIGIVRLLLICVTTLGLIYAIIQRERFLITIHVITLFGWILWLVIGGGILRYGIGVIIWTILAYISLLYSLSRRLEHSLFERIVIGAFIGLLVAAAIWQARRNMLRISTQGGGGPFMRYKTNNGTVQRIDITTQGQITPVNVPTGRYSSQDVFNLQFPHYTKFLQLINERNKDEGALIAGTYARYFVTNQNKIVSDQFLTDLRQLFSDNNVCRSYLRLQDKGLRYLVIDPNIGTVVQGEGNQGLFERFFARLNPVTNAIEQQGTITMLIELVRKGYIRYVSSNNLGAKYALIMPDSAFVAGTGTTDDAITVARAKMMIARFFQDQTNLNQIVTLADQRVKDGNFFTDLADILGLTVSDAVTQKVISNAQIQPNELTEDEKKALMQFFGLRQQLASNPTQYQQTLQNLVVQSLGAGNQVIVVEIVK